MDIEAKSLYDDNYIYSFLTDYFPLLPYELIIRVLRSLEVIEILQFPIFNNPIKYPNLREIVFFDCDVEFISPTMKLSINLESLTVEDCVDKEFYMTDSIRYHESLTFLKISVVSKLGFYKNEDNSSQPESKDVNYKCNLKKLDLIMNYDDLGRSQLQKLWDELELYLGKTIAVKNSFGFIEFSLDEEELSESENEEE